MLSAPWLDDGDVQIHVGDALDVLRGLPDGSVDCCVTSPPYWGLRDYGTGSWDGGEADCDHKQGRDGAGRADGIVDDRSQRNRDGAAALTRQECKCGARRVDQQLGLEATPDEYVTSMVAVFREVRRVLADHGTLWLNLGDSYNNRIGTKQSSHQRGLGFDSEDLQKSWVELRAEGRTRMSIEDGVLKEKDLCGIPWRVAFALQADGWYLRSDIIWAKPNPMPESVTDRPTKAHEMVFLLSKRPRYWFDQEAVREPLTEAAIKRDQTPRGRRQNGGGSVESMSGVAYTAALGDMKNNPAGRNVRSVWEIATQPYPDAHFATFPEELPRRCILAGCPEWVCGTCGAPRTRIVDVSPMEIDRSDRTHALGHTRSSCTMTKPRESATVGWSDCGHANFRPGVVLDPFLGSGTTALVARNHGRRCVGIELNPAYAALAARRLQQLSLLADGAA